MRTHVQIIADAGGYKELAAKLTQAGNPVAAEQARFWARRETIPAEYWPAVARAEVATLEELAADFETRKLARAAEGQTGAAA